MWKKEKEKKLRLTLANRCGVVDNNLAASRGVANMVGVAQLAERLTVAQEVQGSSPCTHPILEDARAVSSAGRAGDS